MNTNWWVVRRRRGILTVDLCAGPTHIWRPQLKGRQRTGFCIACAVLSGFCPVWLFLTPWTRAYQLPCPWGFSRKEYWSALLCTPPGDLPKPGIEPTFKSPALGWVLYHWAHPGRPTAWYTWIGHITQILESTIWRLGESNVYES